MYLSLLADVAPPRSIGSSSGYLIYVVVAAVIALLIAVALLRLRKKPTQLPTKKPAAKLPTEAPQKQLRERPGAAPAPAPEAAEEKREPERAKEKPAAAPPAAAKKPSRELAEGLQKTRAGFISRIGELLRKKEINADLLNELEEVLLGADIGVKTAQHLFEQVRTQLSRQELKDPAAVWSVIKAESRRLLTVDAPPLDFNRAKPFVVLIIGVNGAGKTTTIGKLAAQQIEQGKKVILAAGDTFRAAAVEQLAIWGQRAGAAVVKGKEGGDPSSVIFDAIRRAQSDGTDVVIADTAGRLHVKAQLMEELQKIRRVIKKADPTAPHETLLVLDATNGQNAIAQAKTFKEAMEITGIVLTKLDGTAKGGVILGIAHELGVPVRYIGIGEKIHDLRAFDEADFVDVLYEQADA
jgi:fused signal recognition particle receptor